ncbi:YicC/YloC family endoribonuclease [Candidatus Profftia tarda]|uniref:UPF0701 protein YicC n=1 Tax=Candidatus Profftia tarda TaxID=1177216 RepID=A0A8E4H470_9ENTR|nr:YicC/YloC family endoribonuclease [Candidatus Profftia tarda]CAD6509891.1 UPF0701 protein YicC [Candidatus Profftia tarda]
MIRSMTAYTYRELQNTWGSASWEIRSLNHRYLEIDIRIPEQLHRIEPIVREKLRMSLTRGKIECNLHFIIDPKAESTLILNKELAKQLLEAANWIKMQSDEGEVNPMEFLRWPGMVSCSKQNLSLINDELIVSLTSAIDDLIKAREREGNELKVMIENRLRKILVEITKVRHQIPKMLQLQRERLMSKLQEAEERLENNRLEQEILLIAQRIDVSEELERMEIHVRETQKILKKKEAVGRRLGFMMQELNRESNTLASKSINTDVTASAIELKVLIEQMREQIQNIE